MKERSHNQGEKVKCKDGREGGRCWSEGTEEMGADGSGA